MNSPGRKVNPHGPKPADIYIVGEAPGREEANRGIPFCGMSGDELNNYLLNIGIQRYRCRVNNVWPYQPPGNRDPKPEEIEKGAPYLLQDIAETGPKYIIALGKISASVFADREVVLEYEHGIPFYWCGIIVIPCYHPAAGLHKTKIMSRIIEDFKIVDQVVHHGMKPREEVDYVAEYSEIHSVLEFWDIIDAHNPEAARRSDWSTEVGVDTETVDQAPWSVQISMEERTGYFIAVNNHAVMKELKAFLEDGRVLTVLHNAIFDYKMLRRCGIIPARFTDTMSMAYLLGSEPKGLKALAFRYTGVRMNSYLETVKPSANKVAKEYLDKIVSMEWPQPDAVAEIKSKKLKVRQPQNIAKRVATLLKKYAKDQEIDLYEKWSGMKNTEQVTDLLGPMPEGRLDLIDRERAVHYACMDADMSLQMKKYLYPRIEKLGMVETLERDMGCVPMIVDMEENGMKIDQEYFRKFGEELEERMDNIQTEITLLMRDQGFLKEDEFYNPDSSDVCRQYLDYLKINTKTTEAKYLEPYRSKHKGIDLHIQYKKLSKLNGTYVKGLLQRVDDDGRIRTRISLTTADTGRLASSDPNLQNIPSRTKDGQRIREGFIT